MIGDSGGVVNITIHDHHLHRPVLDELERRAVDCLRLRDFIEQNPDLPEMTLPGDRALAYTESVDEMTRRVHILLRPGPDRELFSSRDENYYTVTRRFGHLRIDLFTDADSNVSINPAPPEESES